MAYKLIENVIPEIVNFLIIVISIDENNYKDFYKSCY